MLGRAEPRLWTPPLRELTPDTSEGFDWIEFAREPLRRPLLPWQEWLAIHAGELLPDGRPRFRIVLVLVARQNGKTEILVVLSLYWQFICLVPMILGTSTNLPYAKESWDKATTLAEETEEWADLVRGKWTREANGEVESKIAIPGTRRFARYKIAPANRKGGRSLTTDRLICDELREHHDYSAWAAAEPTTSAVWGSQIWALSNAGDDTSVVLNDLREQAIAFIRTGVGDPRVGMFEWSMPEDADVTDIDALAQANPALGHTIDPAELLAKAVAAKAKGGAALALFETEYGCRRVKKLDPAVNPQQWAAGYEPGDLSGSRGRIACCIDLSPDAMHATLVAAAKLPDGRVRGEVVAAWSGPDCTDRLRRELGPLLRRVQPRALGWMPSGPAAALAADLADRTAKDRPPVGWPPPGVAVEEIRGEVPAICMGLADLVTAGDVVHPDDPLLNDHVTGAERLHRGDVWVFSRKGEGHCDGAYALAGAVHLARTLPAPLGKPRLIVVEDA